MNKLVVSLAVCSLFMFAILIPALGNEPGYGIAAMSVINMRLTPSYAGEMGTQALMGTPMRILETEGGWNKVMTPEGYTSWATEGSVIPVSEADYKAWNSAQKVIVTDYFTTLRSKPSSTAEVVSDAVWGDVLRNLGKNGGYFKVQLPDSRTAYLKKKSSMPFDKWLKSRRPTPANLVATAKKFTGFPYLWGGTSVKGMDCSGFTKTCYYLNGVILLRNASQQATTGENVEISQGLDLLQPGDLLFFGSTDNGKEHIWHVGMYIGNGEFIHSLGTVHISSLKPEASNYDAGNAKRLVRARRILTQIDHDPEIISIMKHSFYQ